MKYALLCLAAATLIAVATSAQHPNDDCPGAIAVLDGVSGPFTSIGATDSLPPWPCGAAASADLWFAYTASCTGVATAQTCSLATDFDTKLEIFDGDCGSLASLGCNDDGCPGYRSSISWNATASRTYLLRVGGYDGATGNFELALACVPTLINDECSGAIGIDLGSNGPFSTIGASASLPPLTCGVGPEADVWFRFLSADTGRLTVDTCSPTTDFDTRIEVLDGNCSALNVLACNDDTCALRSSVTLSVVAGLAYYIRIGGYAGTAGSFDLILSYGTATGAFSEVVPACSALQLTASGWPNLGHTVTFELSGQVGPFFYWFGREVSIPLCSPGATCALGAMIDVSFPGSQVVAPIPNEPLIIGADLTFQAADLGAPAGCPTGLASLPYIVTSNAIKITIG